jgi:hypothetical protein
LSSESDKEPVGRDERRAWLFLLLLGAFLVVAVWLALTYFHGDAVRPQTPCEDQAPPECIDETIEQADSSQFARYRYCACMTDDGAKGYLATIDRGSKAN